MKTKLLLIFLCTLSYVALTAQGMPPVQSAYKLRPGDELILSYRITPEYNQDVILGPDGRVSLYVAGDVQLSGLTVQQAHDLILQRESTVLNAPELSLLLKDFDKPFVVVAGEVMTPGKILIRQDLTALQAVMLAGGFKLSSFDSQVLVYRRLGGGSDLARVYLVNIHNIKKQSQLQQDMALMAGDMLMVPANKLEHFSRYVRLNPIPLGFNLSNFF